MYEAPPPRPAPPRSDYIADGLLTAARSVAAPRGAPPKAIPAVNPYPDTAIPDSRSRLLMDRFSCGFTHSTWRQLKHAGGPDAWFEQQLTPGAIGDRHADAVDAWYPDRTASAETKWSRYLSGKKDAYYYELDLANWSLLKRTRSQRQLLEVMVDFWSNYFHVASNHDLAWSWRARYDTTIRRLALTTFEDLLVACSLHPAMLLYLSTYASTKDHPDENQGRELLELHTVGVGAGYTEDMVKASSNILTGYTVNVWRNWRARYDPSIHWQGPVQVLDFASDNADADGRGVTDSYLRYLARHPATATRIVTKLARRFVSDTPSDQLISDLARVFTSSGTDIKATIRALISHPEFAASAGMKVRSPVEDFLATARALGVRARRPAPDGDFPFASAQADLCGGIYPFIWPRPDGLPVDNATWSSASRALDSFALHYALAGGWVGDKGSADYRRPAYWIPQRRIRFDQLVDHLSRRLLARPSTPVLLMASCQATGHRVSDVIERDRPPPNWLMARLLTALLDTPEHLSR